MKKYYIENRGCDDTTEFEIELTDEELKKVIRLFEENNKKIRDRDWIICGHIEKEYEDRYQRDHVWYHENHISDE